MNHRIRTLSMLGLMAGLALAGSARADEGDAGTSSSDQTDAIEDLRATVGNLTAQLNSQNMAWKAAQEYLPTIHVLAIVEYAEEKYDQVNLLANSNAHPYNYLTAPPTNGTANGASGVFIPTSEVEFDGKINQWADWELKYSFAQSSLEDTGVKVHGIALLPFVNTGDWTWNLKIGDFRQYFGIEPQTGTSDIVFLQRALIYGGMNPFYTTANKAVDSKFVGQRVLGLFLDQSHDFGPLGYRLQFTLANDTQNEQSTAFGTKPTIFPLTPAAGGTAPTLVDTAQQTDTNPTEIGRVGVNLNFIPGVKVLNLGVSGIHNSLNTQSFDAPPQDEAYSDIQGADFSIVSDLLHDKAQGEFVNVNTFGARANSTGVIDLGVLTSQAQGWYVTNQIEPLKFFWADAPKVEFDFRYESIDPNLVADSQDAQWVAGTNQAITYGLKWTYNGKDFTTVNYTVYGLDGNFTAAAGTELFAIGEQVYY